MSVTEIVDKEVIIKLDNIQLSGALSVPHDAVGLVLFSHGTGSSRFSPRNNMVAEILRDRGIGTLLFDLLTADEDETYENRFDIDLLTERLLKVTAWAKDQEEAKDLSIGYFGASTGAASALNAAAVLGDEIKAVVSRGGRPDLAMPEIDMVKAATLLLVGELDTTVILLNQRAFRNLYCKKELKIIEGASHLFEESGKLEEVAKISANWFNENL